MEDVTNEYYKEERNKSLIIRKIKNYEKSIANADEFARKDKLLAEVLNKRKQELIEESEPLKEFRQKHIASKTTIEQISKENLTRKHELDCVEALISTIDECLALCQKPFNREESIQEDIEVIEEQIEKLDNEISLKKKKFKSKYSDVLKHGDDMNFDLSEKPYARRLLNQIEELEGKRNNLQTRLDELKSKLV